MSDKNQLLTNEEALEKVNGGTGASESVFIHEGPITFKCPECGEETKGFGGYSGINGTPMICPHCMKFVIVSH